MVRRDDPVELMREFRHMAERGYSDEETVKAYGALRNYVDQQGREFRRTNGAEPVVVCLEDIEEREVDWLWEPWLPKGELSALQGDPGVGKSMAAITVAAAVTTGGSLPAPEAGWQQPTEPGSVLWMSREDAADYVLRPRFRSAGGNAKRFYLLEGKREGDDRTQPVTMKDLDVLSKAIETHRPALLVIDPFQAYLGDGVDMSKSEQTRPILAGLNDLVREHRLACLLLRHETKNKERRSIDRALGGVDITGACRVSLGAGQTPAGEGVLYGVKTNLGRHPRTIGYSITDGPVLEFCETELTERDLQQPRPGRKSKKSEAEEFVSGFLGYGYRKSEDMNSAAAREGIADATLRLARKALGVRWRNIGGTHWSWLPGTQEPTEESK